ncbi:MAG: hypothetical protein GY940_24880 [bacterium]|nr:hypothetical protein [bacterium]
MSDIPEWVMKIARQVEGLDPDDRSQDHLIKMKSKRQLMETLAQWRYGEPGWVDSFFFWMQEIYGVSEVGVERLSRENENLTPTQAEFISLPKSDTTPKK